MAGIAALGGRAAYIGKVADDDLGNVFGHELVVLILFADRNSPDAERVEVEGPNFARYLFSNTRAGLARKNSGVRRIRAPVSMS